MKAHVTIGDRKPDEVNITGISFRPYTNKIVLYVDGERSGFDYTPEEFRSIIIGDSGKAIITAMDLQVISEIYAVLNWLGELELPMFEFDIN